MLFQEKLLKKTICCFCIHIAFYLLYIHFSMLALLDSTVRDVYRTRAMVEDMVLAMCHVMIWYWPRLCACGRSFGYFWAIT